MGEQYTFLAMDADTKLVFSWLPGKRTTANTIAFMRDAYARTKWGLHPQLTTDGWGPYRLAVDATFRDSVDFAQLQQVYSRLPELGRQGYAPPRFVEAVSRVRTGSPDKRYISTSYIERQNLTLRMMSRRFTRLTNDFSKKLSHLRAAVTLHFAYYNFYRVHSSLRTTPGVRVGLTDHIWSIAELLGMLCDLIHCRNCGRDFVFRVSALELPDTDPTWSAPKTALLIVACPVVNMYMTTRTSHHEAFKLLGENRTAR